MRESQKLNEQTRIIENRLSTAEVNREKELSKKIENIRKHVGHYFLYTKKIYTLLLLKMTSEMAFSNISFLTTKTFQKVRLE